MRTCLLATLLTLAFAAPVAAQERALAVAQRALDRLDPAACRPASLDVRDVRLALVVHRDGAWALAIGPMDGTSAPADALAAFRVCLEAALSAALPARLPRAPRTAQVAVRSWSPTPPPAEPAEPPIETTTTTEPHDGRAGAICRWGERRHDAMTLPTPRACRAGLTCCAAGGAAGSDSTCVRVSGHCPMYP